MRNNAAREEARALFLALGPLIAAPPTKALPHELGMAMVGMRKSLESPELRSVLRGLAVRIAAYDEPWPTRAVADVAYGLQNTTGSPEARALVLALIPGARTCGRFQPADVGKSFYGLHRLSMSPERDLLLAELVPQVYACAGLLSESDITMAVFGLQNAPQTAELRRWLVAQLRPLPGALSVVHASMCLAGLLSAAAAGVDTGPELRLILDKIPKEGPRPAALRQMLALCGVQPAAGQRAAQLPPECATERALRRLLLAAGVSGLRFNVLHPSGFELDILGRTPTGQLVNVEIEGTSARYLAEGKRRLWDLRERHLRSAYGIEVRYVSWVDHTMPATVAAIADCFFGPRRPPQWKRAQWMARAGWVQWRRGAEAEYVTEQGSWEDFAAQEEAFAAALARAGPAIAERYRRAWEGGAAAQVIAAAQHWKAREAAL
eukprot:TRINITY_DN26060_c0_g1_i2.p1 TRINITY_DN26060_c0_g1~~TRINITY_DN26060_c0_g1_i2.p1  ORF type:complete len:435 (+),score=113.20 TRINITY_DN26060_c0_g1_i2:1303-2607(+)